MTAGRGDPSEPASGTPPDAADTADTADTASTDPGARPTGRSDAELIALVRGRAADPASTEAFGLLYARHRAAAAALARQLARSPTDADDLVAGAFARLLEVLRSGRGPTEAFRAYLLTAMRHLAYDRTRAERRLDLTDDLAELIGVDPDRTVVPFADPALAGLERTLAARAFATLPERWQAVLWHLEVEGDAPADIAPLFGLTPNAVSALGYRAREGLRQAYLQEHLASGSGHRDRRHRETGERLGAYTRGGLSRRDAARVEAHLAECEDCRFLAGELREVNAGLVRAVVGPLVLGAGLVGYLASRGGGHLVAGIDTATGDLAVGGGTAGLLAAVGEVVRPGVVASALGALPGGVATAGALGVVGIAAASFASFASVAPFAPFGSGAPGGPDAVMPPSAIGPGVPAARSPAPPPAARPRTAVPPTRPPAAAPPAVVPPTRPRAVVPPEPPPPAHHAPVRPPAGHPPAGRPPAGHSPAGHPPAGRPPGGHPAGRHHPDRRVTPAPRHGPGRPDGPAAPRHDDPCARTAPLPSPGRHRAPIAPDPITRPAQRTPMNGLRRLP